MVRSPIVNAAARHLHVTMAVVGLVVLLASLLGLSARASFGAQVAADEPQYLLTAGALFERQDLDIGPDLRVESWRSYHQADLPQQTAALPGGQRLSPHDPLLPAILAVPFGLGGWVGAKAAMAVLAGLLAAALVWVAVVRMGVSVRVAAGVVAGFGTVAPLVVYGTQIYPELPAALAVTVALGSLLGTPSRRSSVVWILAVIALPWLAVKYVPVAGALAVIGLARMARPAHGVDRRLLAVAVALLLVAAAGFARTHQAIYGGLTPYAVGDHFGGGELTVMGDSPDYLSRAQRLVGLLVDRDFGLVAWAPAFLLVVPALGALARRRPPGWLVLVLPLVAGWFNATFVALTMHGWWWPGRQVVVVLPAVVLIVAWWMESVARQPRWRNVFAAATAFGVLAWGWLLVEVRRGTSTMIVDFASTTNPLSRGWRLLLPDLRVFAGLDLARLGGWTLVLAGLAITGWRHCSPVRDATHPAAPAATAPTTSPAIPEPRRILT